MLDTATAPPSQEGSAADSAQSQEAAQRVFSTSLLVSATRCLITYVLLPFVAPAVGLAASVGPGLGAAVGVVAIGANLVSIRRFHASGHRWRWHYTAVASGIIGLLAIMLVQDFAALT